MLECITECFGGISTEPAEITPLMVIGPTIILFASLGLCLVSGRLRKIISWACGAFLVVVAIWHFGFNKDPEIIMIAGLVAMTPLALYSVKVLSLAGVGLFRLKKKIT